MLRPPILLALGLAACAAPADDDDTREDATPPPEASVGCDPLSLVAEEVCDDGRNVDAYSLGTEFCPEFWAAADIEDGWTALASRWTMDFGAVQPAGPPDSWEYRNIQGEVLTPELPFDVIVRVGTPCAGAGDEDACLLAFEALRPVEGFVSGCGPAGCTADYLAGTAGDDVFAVTDAAGMAAFLGPIDALPEALLLASASVDGFGWSAGDLRGGAARPVEDGWELLGTIPVWTAPFRADVLRLHVPVDGAVEVLDRALQALDCGALE
jgi:hypothetical protein